VITESCAASVVAASRRCDQRKERKKVSPLVIARHSRSKNGVASLAHAQAIQYSVTFQYFRSAGGYWMSRLRGA
jgi:hypothetical protein